MINDKNIVRPLLLVPHDEVNIIYDVNFDGIAAVSNVGARKFVITINLLKASEMFASSWLANKIPYSMFEIGLELHEISHIKFESFKVRPDITNPLFKTIHNILLDSQCEYSLSVEHPSITVYIRIILSVLKTSIDAENRTEETEKLAKRINELFYLTRFGVILKEADERFINFALPFILIATRGDVHSVMSSSKIIYHYLISTIEDEELVREIGEGENIKEIRGALVDFDLKEVENGEAIMTSSTSNLIKSLDASIGIGKTDTKIEFEEKDSLFYRMTVEKHLNMIKEIRKKFKMRLDQIIKAPTYDGDINYSRQQQAYIASFTGEPSQDYIAYKRIDKMIDVVIIRDISGSTTGSKTEYAELTIVLLEAISNLPGIRVAEIAFSNDALLEKNFHESVNKSRIFPRADGGTYLSSAYEIVKDLSFKSNKKIAIVITDGGVSDPGSSGETEEILKRNINMKFSKWNIEDSDRFLSTYPNGVKRTTFETFPNDIGEWLLREIR